MRKEKVSMARYIVRGTVLVNVETTVEADSEEHAYEVAANERPELSDYVGNGGIDKLIGVDGELESVESSDTIEWNEAELLGDAA